MVKELFNARAYVHDPKKLKEIFSELGYVYLPSLIPADKVQSLRQGVDDIYADLSIPVRDISGDNISEKAATESGLPVLKALNDLDSFHELSHTESLKEVVKALLGDDVLVHPRKFLRTSLPQSLPYSTITEAHQDHLYVQGTPDTLTTWIPLDDYTPEDGVLKVLEGSHKDGLLGLVEKEESNLTLCSDVAENDPRWRASTVHAGDVIIFHSLTVHAGMKNQSNNMRLSVDFRYQSKKEVFGKHNLLSNISVDEGVDAAKPQEWSGDKQLVLPEEKLLVEQVPFKNYRLTRSSRFTL